MLRTVGAMLIAGSVAAWTGSPALGAYFASFDRGETDGWVRGQIQSKVRLGRAGGAWAADSSTKDWWHRTANIKWRKSLYTTNLKSYLTFAYYITKSTDMAIIFSSSDRKPRHSVINIPETVPYKWTYVVLYLGRGSRKTKGFGYPKGVTLNYLTIRAGSGNKRKKHQFELYIDDVRITEGISAGVRSTYAKQQRQLGKYTFKLASHNIRLNRDLILKLARKIRGKQVNPKTVLVVGDALAADEKLAAMRGGCQLIRDPAVVGVSLEMDAIVKALPAVLETHKPEVVVVWMGWREVSEQVAARRAYMRKVSLGEADAAKAPSDEKLRKAAEKALASVVDASIEAGAVPILIYLPPIGSIRGGGFIAATEVLGMNSVVQKVAKKREIPVIDAFSPLAPAQGARRRRPPRARGSQDGHPKFPWLLAGEKGLVAKSYAPINSLYGKLYRALEAELFQQLRQKQALSP